MSAGVDSLANPDELVNALDNIADEREQRKQTIEQLDETRERLETAADPDHVLDADAKHEPSGIDAYEMTQSRRVGTQSIHVDGEGQIRFGKPSGRAGMELLQVFDDLEGQGAALIDQVEYATATLGEWSVEDEFDADYWMDAVGLLDAIQISRDVALGGNGPKR